MHEQTLSSGVLIHYKQLQLEGVIYPSLTQPRCSGMSTVAGWLLDELNPRYNIMYDLACLDRSKLTVPFRRYHRRRRRRHRRRRRR